MFIEEQTIRFSLSPEGQPSTYRQKWITSTSFNLYEVKIYDRLRNSVVSPLNTSELLRQWDYCLFPF
ncbi:unnamed protein product [Schistosoma intercalatum]|nr:unnamed protein product [Schistosoma intercalatum]